MAEASIRVAIRRVVRLGEFESFELTEEVTSELGPDETIMTGVESLRTRLTASVDSACEQIKARGRSATHPGGIVPPVRLQDFPSPIQAVPESRPTPPASSAYPPCPSCGHDLRRKTGTSRAGNAYDMVACTNRDCAYIMPQAERARYA
jgi:hypothetical protein